MTVSMIWLPWVTGGQQPLTHFSSKVFASQSSKRTVQINTTEPPQLETHRISSHTGQEGMDERLERYFLSFSEAEVLIYSVLNAFGQLFSIFLCCSGCQTLMESRTPRRNAQVVRTVLLFAELALVSNLGL